MAVRGGEGGGRTLVTLFLWLNNGREEMLKMAEQEVKRGVLESPLHARDRQHLFPLNTQLIVFKRSGNTSLTLMTTPGHPYNHRR